MPNTIKVGYKQLMAEAEGKVKSIAPEEAIAMAGREDVIVVDIRDPRELEAEGRIPGSFHAPRGMLEFWVDPESPYHKPILSSGKRLVFYCGSGWRSALSTKTVQDMGLANVCHLGGGYTAWKSAGGEIEAVPAKPT